MKSVTEHMGIKYSLQPHGLRSKLFWAFAVFVVVFGGALLVAMPVQAAPGSITCNVDTTTPSPNPSGTPDPSPSPTVSPTPCPTPAPVTTTITKKVTVYVNQTTTSIETVTIAPSESPLPSPSAAPLMPSTTSDPLPPVKPTSGGGSLVGWGVATVGVLGVLLASMGLIGVIRGRRRKSTRETGRHHIDNTETTLIPVVRDSSDDHDVYDYGHGDYDPALGGRAGETMQMPAAEPDSSEDTDTKPLPPVQ